MTWKPGDADAMLEFQNSYEANRTTDSSLRLVSDSSPILQRIVALVPSAGRVEAGQTKGAVWRTATKIQALSQAYIVLGDRVLGAMRIDMDRNFGSFEHLEDELRSVPLPCLPHLIIGTVDHETRALTRPHLILLLPPDAQVWNDVDDPRCRQRPVRLYHAVHSGITRKLVEIGADIGGLANPLKIKSPFSPMWTTKISNSDTFPTLREWTDWVDIETSVVYEKGKTQASNNVFGFLRTKCWEIATRIFNADPDAQMFGKDRTMLETVLLIELEKVLTDHPEFRDPRMKTAQSVADYTAKHFDPARAKSHGRLHEQLRRVPIGNRQSQAGQIVAEERRERTLKELLSLALAHDGATPLTKKALSKISRRSRPTIDSHWGDLERTLHDSREFVQVQLYPDKDHVEKIDKDYRFLIEDDFISNRRAIFQTRIEPSSLPADCGAVCNHGERCRLQEIIVDRSGFKSIDLPCYQIKNEILTGPLQFRLRDWKSSE